MKKECRFVGALCLGCKFFAYTGFLSAIKVKVKGFEYKLNIIVIIPAQAQNPNPFLFQAVAQFLPQGQAEKLL